MNRHAWFGGFLVVLCLAMLWRVWGQRKELAGLRAEEEQLQAQLAASADNAAAAVTGEVATPDSTTHPQELLVTPELLRLRSEVTQLIQRRNELAGARVQNERLRAQLAGRGTNGPAGFQLPRGYVRKSEARMVGYNAPADTLQSLLWAIQNHDLTNLLQAFTPEEAQQMRGRAGQTSESIEDFFRNAAGLVGLGILGQTQNGNGGSVVLEVEVTPGMPHETITLDHVNGQWKIAGPF